LIVYLVLIGPADYFLLRRWVRRMEMTWLTLSLVILLFCATAVLLANAWKGNSRRLNQVDLVDVDLESGLTRGTTWANLFTPRTVQFDLGLEPTPPLGKEPTEALFAWQGLPGAGLGGMDGKPTGALFPHRYGITSGGAKRAHRPGSILCPCRFPPQKI
jgi:hypothetical protein